MTTGNIDREKPCPECGEVSILDGEARICYECWQLLVLAEAEEEENRLSEDEILDDIEQNPYVMG